MPDSTSVWNIRNCIQLQGHVTYQLHVHHGPQTPYVNIRK